MFQKKLGWIVYGGNGDESQVSTTCVVKTYDDEVLQEPKNSEVDTSYERFLSNFIENSLSDNGERYKVAVPWIEPVEMRSNYSMALDRLEKNIRTLKNRGTFCKYKTKLMEFVVLNFAERVFHRGQPGRTNYLPHHGVDQNKGTTELRIVLDSSAAPSDSKTIEDAHLRTASPECHLVSRVHHSCYSSLFSTISKPQTIQSEAKEIMERAGMNLIKWRTNADWISECLLDTDHDTERKIE